MPQIPINNLPLTDLRPSTFTTVNTTAAVGVLPVKNTTGFTIAQIILLGTFGNDGSEIIRTHASIVPTATAITFNRNTTYPHSSSTPVTVIPYNQVEFSTAETVSGSKSVLATTSIVAAGVQTTYDDTSGSTGYYFAQFKNSITGVFSDYSSATPVAGYTRLMARSIIDTALEGINKTSSDVLPDAFAFKEIDNCQTETIRELKRWSFMQKFDTVASRVVTGMWKIPLPTDVDDQNTNKSIWNVRLGKEQRLTWVDKERFNSFMSGTVYTTLSAAASVGASTLTLVSSNDFGNSGTIQVRANALPYTANNRATGVITLTDTLNTAVAAGIEIFQGASLGLPNFWTTFGGSMYVTPVTASTYNNRNVYMDYYKTLTQITADTDEISLPDPTLVQYYLQWKFLKRINNGNDTEGSIECKNNYLIRQAKLKQKESMNREFRLKPTINRSGGIYGDGIRQRLGNFEDV